MCVCVCVGGGRGGELLKHFPSGNSGFQQSHGKVKKGNSNKKCSEKVELAHVQAVVILAGTDPEI